MFIFRSGNYYGHYNYGDDTDRTASSFTKRFYSTIKGDEHEKVAHLLGIEKHYADHILAESPKAKKNCETACTINRNDCALFFSDAVFETDGSGILSEFSGTEVWERRIYLGDFNAFCVFSNSSETLRYFLENRLVVPDSRVKFLQKNNDILSSCSNYVLYKALFFENQDNEEHNYTSDPRFTYGSLALRDFSATLPNSKNSLWALLLYSDEPVSLPDEDVAEGNLKLVKEHEKIINSLRKLGEGETLDAFSGFLSCFTSGSEKSDKGHYFLTDYLILLLRNRDGRLTISFEKSHNNEESIFFLVLLETIAILPQEDDALRTNLDRMLDDFYATDFIFEEHDQKVEWVEKFFPDSRIQRTCEHFEASKEEQQALGIVRNNSLFSPMRGGEDNADTEGSLTP